MVRTVLAPLLRGLKKWLWLPPALETASILRRSCNRDAAMSSPWPTLLLAPLHELAKQSLAFGLALRRTGSGAIQESLEIAADVSLGRCRRAVETREHLLGDGVAIPARNRGA
jgi:hypothetical protein